MTPPDRPWLAAPPGVRQAFGSFEWRLIHASPGHSVVHRLSQRGRRDLFLKLAPADAHPGLAREAERMRWAGAFLPVPAVVDAGEESDVAWLATSPLEGRPGTHPDLLARPADLVRILALGLRRFHEAAPVGSCPFDFRLEAAFAHVRTRLERGAVDPARDFHPEHADLDAAGALERLEAERPGSEDLVVCHGDYCPPNVLVRTGRVTGYLDLGELGVADRWWDLAVATWALEWNVGPGWEGRFLEEYGAGPDPARIRFYRLLYDVVS